MVGTLRMNHLWLAIAMACFMPDAAAADKSSVATHCFEEADPAKDLETTLLQQQLMVRSADNIMSNDQKEGETERKRKRDREKYELPTNITWVHVPRTGASFAYTLLQLNPSICIPGSGHLIPADGYLGAVHVEDVRRECPHIILSSFCGDSTPFDLCAEKYIGDLDTSGRQLVGFFRQPEERIVSDWWHQTELNRTEQEDVEQYARSEQGCAVKMLTRPGKLSEKHCNDGLEPTFAEVDLAVLRLKNEYAFIGMTDAWDLSICLFNAMFGNQCHSNQFSSYSFHESSTNSSDVSMLNGWVDPYDAVLWGVAQQIFEENLRRFNVSEENCQPCK